MSDDVVSDLEQAIGLELAAWTLRQRADEHRRMALRVENLGKESVDRARAAEAANLPGGKIAITEHNSEAAAYRGVWAMLTAEAQFLEAEADSADKIAKKREAERWTP